MSRTVTNAFLTALQADTVTLFYAVELSFDSGAVRLWTGRGNKTISGNTYQGTGALLGVSGMEEAADMSAKGATVTLTGIDSSIVSLAINEPYQGRSAKIYLGIVGETDVAEVFSGVMDVMTIEDSGDTSTITVTLESKLVSLDRPVALRYTHRIQDSLYSGDTFFSYVTKLQDKPIFWGRNKNQKNNK